jgi:hypothetical protein
MLSAARQSCRTTSAQALVCQPQAIQSALLARNTQKPISRRCLWVEATSHAASTGDRHRRPLDEFEPIHQARAGVRCRRGGAAASGLATDDVRDALDRRVEFRTVDCR